MSLHIWRSCKRGFTLLEILISVTLVSVIMLLIWQTTSQSISAKKRIEHRQEFYHLARVALNKIVDDLSMAFLLIGTQHVGQRQGSPILKTVFDGESEKLEFASLSHLRLFEGSKESEGTEIGYKIEDSTLYRREAKSIDDNPSEGGVWTPMAYKVKEFHAEYFDGEKFDWKSSWNSESGEKGKLPRAVKLTLTLEHPANPKEDLPFTTIVLVGMHQNAIGF